MFLAFFMYLFSCLLACLLACLHARGWILRFLDFCWEPFWAYFETLSICGDWAETRARSLLSTFWRASCQLHELIRRPGSSWMVCTWLKSVKKGSRRGPQSPIWRPGSSDLRVQAALKAVQWGQKAIWRLFWTPLRCPRSNWDEFCSFLQGSRLLSRRSCEVKKLSVGSSGNLWGVQGAVEMLHLLISYEMDNTFMCFCPCCLLAAVHAFFVFSLSLSLTLSLSLFLFLTFSLYFVLALLVSLFFCSLYVFFACLFACLL